WLGIRSCFPWLLPHRNRQLRRLGRDLLELRVLQYQIVEGHAAGADADRLENKRRQKTGTRHGTRARDSAQRNGNFTDILLDVLRYRKRRGGNVLQTHDLGIERD